MKTTLSLLGLLALALLSGCSDSHTESLGGETNWLMRCDDDAACDVGSCLCGVCATACDDDSACRGDFPGSCTQVDSKAGEALCADAMDAPEAVCLPACSSNDECGDGFSCVQGTCVPRASSTPDPMPKAGSGSEPPPIQCMSPDGTLPDGGCDPDPDPQLAQLTASRAAWDELVAMRGETYWYEEENCADNASEHPVTRVQVDVGSVRIAHRRMLNRSDCMGRVNRYSDFSAKTMPELYEECAGLLERQPPKVTVTLDERGLLASCVQDDEPDCNDACGNGFLLRTLRFGLSPSEGGTDPDTGLPASCGLADELGTCAALFENFYFDPTTGQCEPFVYGGCEGNENNFESLEACRGLCESSSNNETACEVNGTVYMPGDDDVPDPYSCNTCSCDGGHVTGCTEIACPMPCAEGTAPGNECAQCGPGDGCEILRTGCLPTCEDEGQQCEGGGLCNEGVCRILCG